MRRIRKKLFTLVLIPVLALTLYLSACGLSGEKQNKGSGVATTSVAISQILDALGYDNVVGVPESEIALPKRYEGVRTVGAPMNPDLEILKDINPEIVLSPLTLKQSLGIQYTGANLNAGFLDLSSVSGMYNAINNLGQYLGKENEAAVLYDDYLASVDAYKSQQNNRPSVLILMAYPDGFYLVATEDSYVGNLVSIAGGDNVYGKGYVTDGTGIASISPEDMIQKAPDKILVFAHYSEESAFSYMRREFETNNVWTYYDAANNDEIHYLPSGYFGMSCNLSWRSAIDFLMPILAD